MMINWRRMMADEPDLEGAIDRLGETALQIKAERDVLEAALKASTAIRTIEGGIKMAREALVKAGA
jgi:hypothetical protein